MNRIVNESCKTLKTLAKQTLKECWQEAVVFTFVCYIILQMPAIIYGFIPEGLDKTGIIARAVNVYSFLISGPINLALGKYFINTFRQKERGFGEIKFGFDHYIQALLLYVRILIITTLWSMFFVIPGIIASIAYSQSFNILADNPGRAPAQCMRESKFIMQGNKLKYALLILSFAGWYLLALSPALICQSMLVRDPVATAQAYIAEGNINAAINVVLYKHPIVSALELLIVFPLTYLNTAEIAFFDILVGKLVVQEVDEIRFEAAPDQAEESASEDNNNE